MRTIIWTRPKNKSDASRRRKRLLSLSFESARQRRRLELGLGNRPSMDPTQKVVPPRTRQTFRARVLGEPALRVNWGPWDEHSGINAQAFKRSHPGPVGFIT